MQKLKGVVKTHEPEGNKVFGGYITEKIHPLVSKGIAYISLHDNITVEGIFRVSGDAVLLNQLKKEFNEGKYDSNEFKMEELVKNNVHNAASLLKMYFREMAEPLLTFDHYDMFIAAHGIPDKETRIAVIKKVLRFLPKKNMQLLKTLCKFLNLVKRYSDSNKMNSSNLAIVFAPNLLKPKGEQLQMMMSDSPHTNGLMVTLIEEYELIFEAEDLETTEDVSLQNNAKNKSSSKNLVPSTAKTMSQKELPLPSNVTRKKLPEVPKKANKPMVTSDTDDSKPKDISIKTPKPLPQPKKPGTPSSSSTPSPPPPPKKNEMLLTSTRNTPIGYKENSETSKPLPSPNNMRSPRPKPLPPINKTPRKVEDENSIPHAGTATNENRKA
jgi:hypothetical protein